MDYVRANFCAVNSHLLSVISISKYLIFLLKFLEDFVICYYWRKSFFGVCFLTQLKFLTAWKFRIAWRNVRSWGRPCPLQLVCWAWRGKVAYVFIGGRAPLIRSLGSRCNSVFPSFFNWIGYLECYGAGLWVCRRETPGFERRTVEHVA
jgi:hypothetical protein